MANVLNSTRADARASSPATSTTRRALVAGIAASPIAALPAVADVTADPIFAVLERHRAAREALERSLPAFNEAEARWFEIQKQYPGAVELLGPWANFSSEAEIDKALSALAARLLDNDRAAGLEGDGGGGQAPSPTR